MNEPKRWLEEGPPEAVERLLQAAAAEQPADGSLKRLLAGVGAGLGATGAAATAGAAGSAGAAATAGTGAALATGKVVTAAWAKWVVLSVAAVGAGTAAVKQASNRAEAPRVAATATATAAPRPVAAREVAPVAATTPVVAVPATEAPAAVAPVKAGSVAAPAHAPRAVAAPAVEAPIDAERLAEEVRAVDRARSALAAGRGKETLSALDEYESRFGGRRFAPEALYLRMQALLSLGRKAEARSTAERLIKAFPQSPHTARARRVLSETNP